MGLYNAKWDKLDFVGTISKEKFVKLMHSSTYYLHLFLMFNCYNLYLTACGNVNNDYLQLFSILPFKVLSVI